MTVIPDMPWCVIHSEDLIDLLHQAHEGANPEALFTEWYANSEAPDDDAREAQS